MNIKSIPQIHSNRLAQDYILGKTSIRDHYDRIAHDASDWDSRVAYLANKPLSADREQLVQALSSYNRKIGNSQAALDHIEQLRSSEAMVIVGGQQSGLFTGPVLVIYKAITIIRQAREAAEHYGRPVIPVFWIAGEDHDYAEVDHIDWLNSDLNIERLQLSRRTDNRISISHLSISAEEWESALRELAAALPDTEWKAEILNKLRDIHAASETLSDAFARMMAWLFGEEGLVLIDSADPEVRRLEAPMWRELIVHNESLAEAYMTGVRRLEAAGYVPQAEAHPDGANLFCYVDGMRLLLYREGEYFADRHGVVKLTKDELLLRSERDPASFSNNVLTRPLMQDYLFPVLAVVLGPGEIAYWGQIREGFHCLRMEMPVLLPRESYTLVEPVDQKILDKHGLTIEDALKDLSIHREAWLKSQETFDVEGEFAEVEQAIRQLYDPLVKRAGTISPTMEQLGASNLSRIIDQVHYYRNRIDKEIALKHEVGLRQFDRLAASFLPGGVPQERVYNIFAYLNRYGDRWLHDLLHVHRPNRGDYRHQYIVYL